MIKAGVWVCQYCRTESIHIGTEKGSSDTRCPKGCPGRFTLIREYPLATGLEGIKEAFGGVAMQNRNARPVASRYGR